MIKSQFLFAAALGLFLGCTQIPDDLPASPPDPNSSWGLYCRLYGGYCLELGTKISSRDCREQDGEIVDAEACGILPSSSSGGNNPPGTSQGGQSSSSAYTQSLSSAYTQSSSSAYTQSSSSIPSSVQYYCDYGPYHTFGGGCQPVASRADCNETWGDYVTACYRAGTFCDYGAPNSYGGGGCYEISNTTVAQNNCMDNDGEVTGTCSLAGLKTYCYQSSYGDCERIGGNCGWMQDALDCAYFNGIYVTRNQCQDLGIEPNDCN